ncbi:MAG: DegV family protein [Bacilli bacterium]
MEKIKIIVDSTCDLEKEDIEANGIEVIPLNVVFGDKIYRDGIDINTTKLYEMVSESGQLPKTSAVNSEVYREIFKKFIDEGYKLIVYTISADMSCTCQNARIAASEFGRDNVKIIDSENLSTGIGLQVLKCAKFIKEGCSFEEVYRKCLDVRSRVRAQFCVEKLDYLHKGGRCSTTSKIFGTLLKMRPVIAVRHGKMAVDRKPIGKPVKGWQGVLEILKEDMTEHKLDYDNIFITHSKAEAGEEYLYNELKALVPEECIKVSNAGCVISSHCGPGTIGILYILDD